MIPAIFSLAGLEPSPDERALFARVRPAGYILFNRNCRSAAQVRALTDALRDLSNDERLPILIDHEGGRVQMLREPPAGLMGELAELIGRNHNHEFPPTPPAGRFGALWRDDPDAARAAAWESGVAVGRMLRGVGISVNCAPVLDVRREGAHDVIGDRSLGRDPDVVADLGGATLAGLREGGVEGVLKHIPGHGRALVDSHRGLPVVDADVVELERTDFEPFRRLAGDAVYAMTAHIVYAAIDPDRPVTQSTEVIDRIIRGHCGFDGALMTDAIEMAALKGTPGERARRSVEAGCDLVLCCAGAIGPMHDVAANLAPISARALDRLERAKARLAPF